MVGSKTFVRLAVAGILSSGYALAPAGSLLKEIATHVNYARKCLAAEDYAGARASADLILLERVRVYVDPKAPEPLKRALTDALGAWSASLEQETAFEQVSAPQNAHVVVKFVRRLGGGHKEYGGFTRWERRVTRRGDKASWALNATVELRSKQPNGLDMTYDQVRHAAMHEIGHVLGLDDSEAVGEVMGPLDLRAPVRAPRPDEVTLLSDLRRSVRALRAKAR